MFAVTNSQKLELLTIIYLKKVEGKNLFDMAICCSTGEMFYHSGYTGDPSRIGSTQGASRTLQLDLSANSFWQEGSLAYHDKLYGNFRALHFPGWGTTHAYCFLSVPYDLKEGTKLFPEFHWCPKSNQSGRVRFGTEVVLLPEGNAANFGTPIVSIFEHNMSSQNYMRHMKTVFPETAAIDTSALSPGDMVLIRLYRDASNSRDTYNDDIASLKFLVNYEAG